MNDSFQNKIQNILNNRDTAYDILSIFSMSQNLYASILNESAQTKLVDSYIEFILEDIKSNKISSDDLLSSAYLYSYAVMSLYVANKRVSYEDTEIKTILNLFLTFLTERLNDAIDEIMDNEYLKKGNVTNE